jgi:Ca2+-transporting ATPase
MIKEASGLTTAQAKKLLAQYGVNEISGASASSAWKIFWRQVRGNFIVYLLLVAMTIAFAVGKGLTGYTIMVVIALVIGTSFVQEYKAEKAIEYLKKMITQMATVIRNAELVIIPAAEIVPGDMMVLRSGERVPADAVLREATSLLVNEAFLTGESKEVAKVVGDDSGRTREDNLLYAGSFVVNGKCVAQVTHTGMNTKFGKIARLISTAEKAMPLQDKINRIAKLMATVGITVSLMSGAVMLMGQELTTELVVNALILVVALSVSAFPEGLPVVLTTTLSLGAYRMAKKNAIVNRMSIIETLGETTVICADKTGTITKGEMTVKKIYADAEVYDIGGAGYEAVGKFKIKNKQVELVGEAVKKLLACAVLCNDARIKLKETKSYEISGMPTEAALLVMASKAKVFREDYTVERLEELPFDSKRKMMSVLVEEAGTLAVYAKGAPEIMLAKCNSILQAGRRVPLDEAMRTSIVKQWEKLASQAYRTMVLAYKEVDDRSAELESDLVYLGLVAIEDSPREEVAEALATCLRAGIEVKMITGDNLMTAISVAKQIGLAIKKTMTGEELENATDKELAVLVKEVNIFARVRPEHKLRIVRALKAGGEVVTMTGDGINDSPALKEAHIGVAMGINGTDVSRSVADLILKDDNFATIVVAIAEGRAIFNNIRKFTAYQLSCNYAAMAIVFIGVLIAPWLAWPVPILFALHILFMNLVTDNMPAITLGFSNPSKDIMDKMPRKSLNILTKNVIYALLFSALVMTSLSLLAFWLSHNVFGLDDVVSRSLTLVVLIVLQLISAFSFRSFRQTIIGRSLWINKYLTWASLLSIACTLVIIYTPLNQVFETAALGAREWGIVGALALLCLLVFDLVKLVNNRYRWVIFD